jgi:Domain of unknown function (DUF4252)
MKRILTVCCVWLACAAPALAQDFGLYWKYKDYDPKVAFTAPGWLVKVGVSFLPAEKMEKRLLRRLGKTRVMVFEDGSPVTNSDMHRFEKRAKRRGLEDLILVHQANNDIRVMGATKGAMLRKIVVFVKTPDEFVLASVRCRLRFEDFAKLIKATKKRPGTDKPLLAKPPLAGEADIIRGY